MASPDRALAVAIYPWFGYNRTVHRPCSGGDIPFERGDGV